MDTHRFIQPKISNDQTKTFSTYSPIMSASFDVNWMASSLLKYA